MSTNWSKHSLFAIENNVHELERRCRRNYASLPFNKDDLCDKYICLATIDFFGLQPCRCDTIGSFNNSCHSFGGQCQCKPNVYRRRCNECQPTTWGFSKNGCQACNCHYGSKNDSCSLETGKCNCHDHKTGLKCDKCTDGYFNFPNCQKCNCNGLSNKCSSNGTCLDCFANSQGKNCEKCKIGFYGSPSVGIKCKKCPCPGINGNNFAVSCALNNWNNFKCECQEGYTGDRCDKCSPLYYGDPISIGGKCQKCQCNGNIDINDATSCDQTTGECKKCLNNTTGWNCNKCTKGFYKKNNKCIRKSSLYLLQIETKLTSFFFDFESL
jgi:hypothetical protein